MKSVRAMCLLLVLLLAASADSLVATPPASWEPTWDAMYAAWQQGGEAALRAYVKAHRRAVTRELLADIALRGWKERADPALSEARLAIALAAAQEIGDSRAEADALRKAGEYHSVTGAGEKAVASFDLAQALFESVGDLNSQGSVWDGRASALLRGGKTAEAVSGWEKALAFYVEAGNLKGQGNVHRNRGDLHVKTGDAAQARAAYDTALACFEKAGDPVGQAYVYRGQADLANVTGDRAGSLALLEKALALFEQADDLSGRAGTTFFVALRHKEKNEYDKALALLDRALPLFERVNDPLGQGNVNLARGEIAFAVGDTARAQEQYDKAMSFYDKGNQVFGQATAWLRKGELASRLGENDQAVACNDKAVALYEKMKSGRGLAAAIFTRALTSMRIGDHEQAIAMLEKAIALHEKANNVLGLGNATLFLADAYYYLGDYTQALAAFDRALPYLEKANGTIGLGSVYLGRARIHAAAGDAEQALAMCEKALPFYEKAGDPIGQGNVFLQRSSLYHESGDRTQALAMLERALPFFEKGSDPTHLGTLYRTWAQILVEDGNDVGGLTMYEKALPFFDKVSSALGKGQVLSGLAGIHHRKGDDGQALALYQEAIELLRRAGSVADQADALAGEARVHAQAGRGELALQRYEHALGLLDQARRGTGLEALRLSFMAAHLGSYEAATRFMLENGYGEQAFRAAERMRARVFLDRLAEGLVDLEKGVDPELKSRRDALESRSSALGTQRQDLHTAKLGEEVRAQAIAKLTADIEAADRELAEVKEKIRLTNPLYASVQYPQPPTAGEIRSGVLRENEALIEYVLTGEQAWCVVLTRGTFDVVKLPGTPMEIATGVASVVEWAASAGRGAPRPAAAKAAPASGGAATPARLYDILVAPVAGKVAGKTLIIVPDGVLARLPFEMLEVGAGRRARPLMQRYEIRYTPSAAVLAFYRTQYRREGTSERFAGFGDPVYDHESFTAKRAERGVAVGGNGLAGAQAQRGFGRAGVTLARLPGTGEEVRAIGGLFAKARKAEMSFLRAEASEEHAKSADLAGYGYLHFAAHGILDDDYQAIALSQLPGAGEDGLLTLPEIMNLHWDARLVVLSACETGLGPVRRGEGVTGLTRAVMYAGSPAAVVSLWSVSDEGTSELMTRFYGAMVGKKLAPADALRQAKLAMAASSRWRSPYYWAAFVLYGE